MPTRNIGIFAQPMRDVTIKPVARAEEVQFLCIRSKDQSPGQPTAEGFKCSHPSCSKVHVIKVPSSVSLI